MNFLSRSVLTLVALFAYTLTTQAQTYYYIGGNTASVNFYTTTAWSTTLGGAPVSSITPAGATFIFDGDDVSNASGQQIGTTMTLNLNQNTTIGNLIITHNNFAPVIYGINYALTVTGDVTVESTCTLNTQTNIKVGGNLLNNGTLTYDTNLGEFTFTGVNKTISGSGTTQFRKFTVATGAYTTLQCNIGISGALVSFINGTLDASTYLITEIGNITSSISLVGRLRTSNPTGVRGITGATVDPNVTLSIQTNDTIEFYAPSGTQDIWCGNGTAYYYNVMITGGGTKRLVNSSASWIDIRASLTIGAGNTLDVSATGDATNIKDINFDVNFTNNGTFIPRTGTVTVDGSGGTQVITMNGGSFYNLELANPTSNAASLGSDATITHSLIFTNGRLLLGNYNLIFDIYALSPVGGTNLKMLVTNGNGEVKKVTPADGGQFTYAVGEITGTAEYSPVTLNFTSNSAVRTFGVRVVDAQHPNDYTTNNYLTRYWHFSETSAPGNYTYDATFTYISTDVVGSYALMSASYIYLPATTWTAVTTTPATTYMSVTGTSQSLYNAEVTGRVTAGCTPPNQPAAFTTSTTNVCAGQQAVTYTIPNDPSVTYNWSYSGTGATINGSGNSVTVNFASNATGGDLSVTATNICTSTPRTITITVNPVVAPPTFTTGPTTLCAGATATYTATAANSTTIAYSIVGNTGASINSSNGNVSSVTGNFTVRATATGTCGNPTTADRVVTVSPAVGTPTFTTGATTLCAGGVDTYTATASNSNTITYSIVGNTGASINPSNGAVSSVTGNFTVRATASGACGNPTTADRFVTVTPIVGTPTFTAGSTALCTGGSTTYTATAANSNSITYSIVGNTGATINPNTGAISNVTGNFTVRATATGTCGNPTTADRFVTVTNAITITQQPQSATVCLNAPVTFSVLTNDNTAQYVWHFNGNDINNSNAFSYTVANTNNQTAGNYSVSITGTCGSITSNVAVLGFYPVIVTSITDSACSDTVYYFNGQNLNADGTYYDTLTAANTCDSIIMLNLTFTGPVAILTANGANLSVNAGYAGYEWYYNGTLIQGANSANYTATQNGQYSVIVTDANGCTRHSNLVGVNILAVDETVLQHLSIYPNPVATMVFIKGENLSDRLQYTLSDVTGRMLAQQTIFAKGQINYEVDMSSYSAGIYLLTLSNNKGSVQTFKIFKSE